MNIPEKWFTFEVNFLCGPCKMDVAEVTTSMIYIGRLSHPLTTTISSQLHLLTCLHYEVWSRVLSWQGDIMYGNTQQ